MLRLSCRSPFRQSGETSLYFAMNLTKLQKRIIYILCSFFSEAVHFCIYINGNIDLKYRCFSHKKSPRGLYSRGLFTSAELIAEQHRHSI